MANAIRLAVQPPVEPVTVRLDLTEAEAEVLSQIMSLIGGSPDGPRGHASRIDTALIRAGVRNPRHAVDQARHTGVIYFRD